MESEFYTQEAPPAIQQLLARGFSDHAQAQSAPEYEKQSYHWLMRDENRAVVAVLTADQLWDWLYNDELWVAPGHRGQKLGQQLMEAAETFAGKTQLSGLWLWTQSWQAAEFYRALDYTEFTRFDDFPKGHCRIGFRKHVRTDFT